MSGYEIFLSDGDLLTTVNIKTIDEQGNSSLVLIGQGIPNYGGPIAQDFVWMLENFANASPPVHPLVGQQWYDNVNGRMNVYNGSIWKYFVSPESTYSSLFDMALASQNLDFTALGTTAIFTGSDVTRTYCATNMILVPNGAFNATTAATFDLSVASSGDVFVPTAIPIISSSRFVKYSLNSAPRMIVGTQTLNLNVTVAASGGQLNYDVYVFGSVF